MLTSLAVLYTSISLLTFFIPFFIKALFWFPQDLKKKYDAKWAIVTGASSGIGKAIADKLCKQGIDVVLVALDDPALHNTKDELSKKYTDREVRVVGANLAKDGYMEPIIKATQDIHISLVFNNAGFIRTSMFADLPIEQHLAIQECNSTCAIRITHHFLNKMIDANSKGFIAFTSSPAGCMPSPFASLYGSTKAFLTEFGSSIAAEVRHKGVDVTVMHPSPVDSAFYQNTHKISSIQVFQMTATGPEGIANYIFAAAGRTVVQEQGWFCVVVRGLVLKMLDYALFADIMSRFIHFVPDFQKVNAERASKKTK